MNKENNMSELRKAMKEKIPTIDTSIKTVKTKAAYQPTDYEKMVQNHKRIYQQAFQGNPRWEKYLKESK